MRYKAIIFDMDGTIIDSEHIWDQARNNLILSRNLDLPQDLEQELAIQCAGRSMRDCCAIIKQAAGLPESVEMLMQEKHKHAMKLYAQGVGFIAGFIPFHQKAARRQLKMALATNANSQTVALMSTVLNLEQLFGPHVYNGSHVFNQLKPNPAIYLYTAMQLGFDPKECIAIEDSASGISSARGAGMHVIAINTSGRRNLLSHAHQIIDKYSEIDLDTLLTST